MHAERRGKGGGEERHRENTGEPGARLLERIEPGHELLGIGERSEEKPLVLALGGGHLAEGKRRRQPRVPVTLRKAPLYDRLAIRAAQERDLLLLEILAGEVGEHAEQRALAAAQVHAELRDARIVARELRFELQAAARARVEVVFLGCEIKQVARHVRTSSSRWHRRPGRAPRA